MTTSRRSSAGHMSSKAALLLSFLAMSQLVNAAPPWPNNIDPSAQTRTFPLWEHGAPGALGTAEDDVPTLTLYPVRNGPAGAVPTTAVIVAPGGSYGRMSANHEGRQVANWFNSQGVTVFLL